MLLVVTAVAVQGSPVAVQVELQVPVPFTVKVQFANGTAVISRFAALETVAVNDVPPHDEMAGPSSVVVVNPKFGESSVCSEPIVPQLAAEAINGIAKAHNAITTAKSRKPFFDN